MTGKVWALLLSKNTTTRIKFWKIIIQIVYNCQKSNIEQNFFSVDKKKNCFQFEYSTALKI